MAEENTTRKITLCNFKPESYKVWEMSTKATLKYNKLFNIVDSTETDLTPRNDDGTILQPIPAATRDQIEKWKHNHKRAREAIIRCLPDSEILKLDDVQDDVAQRWLTEQTNRTEHFRGPVRFVRVRRHIEQNRTIPLFGSCSAGFRTLR